jgi:transcriptional regulator with XRE-family HTH domain
MTTRSAKTHVDPFGPSAAEETRRAAQRDPALRAELARIAPFEEIAEKVIIGRTMKGYTQEHLAGLADTSYSQISRIESGRHLPDVITLDRLGRILGITFELPLKEVDLSALRPRRRAATLAGPSRVHASPAPVWASGSGKPERQR